MDEEKKINLISFKPNSIKKEPVKGDPREIIRRRYKPIDIKVLFACESLPHDRENFFYYKHSPLFDKTLEAFQKVFPKITQVNFLDNFKEMGFYLDDLCNEPVNQLKNSLEEKSKRKYLRKLYEPDFSKKILIHKPLFIIVTPKEINSNIEKAISQTKLKIPCKELPFPVGSQTNANNYLIALVELLYELLDKKIIIQKDVFQ